ncbi:porin [Laribacter hongkongensis]|uniref:porin n=1 Tax=Laribacter hongkongensis TaxID=168471 RepID=UPI001EFC8D93|nr:porin [Laribacter hongkongensis]MCG8991000.1 porin [Laribacter hongkongensis]MCG8996932.1 porin [Laribacter hongkongensis]MCG9001011.1 porin [Laribacter hongkongensis]MCG9004719.1 porin [Laribacter hongkongensis]MCG9006051.1 porin [Laribacter hongkongensis]
MKKIIAVAIAALPMAAMADVEIYGQLEAAVEAGNTFGYGDVFNTNTRIDDTGSKIGFKGTEDLGNGLKAIWQVESYLSIDGTTMNGGDRGNKFAGRDSFVGLQGNWGKVRLGRLSTYQNDSMERFDPWVYGAGVNGMSYTSANNLDGRVDNAVRYDTPNLNGFKAAILYGTDEQRTEVNGHRPNRSTWNLGAGYEYAGYYVDAGYTLWQDANAAGDKNANYWRLEGGYAANNLLVALAYGQAKTYDGSQLSTSFNEQVVGFPTGATNAAYKSKEAALTVAYTMGNFTPRFSYARIFDITVDGVDFADKNIDQFVIGVDYAMSKRTMAYASYGYVNHDATIYNAAGNDSKSSENTFAVGLVHKF